MNKSVTKGNDVTRNASEAPEFPIAAREACKASGLYVVRALGDEQAPPSSRRGASRSWIPGAWGDPF